MQTSSTNRSDQPLAPTVPRGDFSSLAKQYVHRPGYSHDVLRLLAQHVGANARDDFAIADVGAGTGKLTLDLHECGHKCVAVEPNAAMYEEGRTQTAHTGATWLRGSGEDTGLPTASVDWVLMASSFHWVHLERGLAEFRRILRPGGHFTALWNPRDTMRSELHSRIEARIEAVIPGLTRVSSGSSRCTSDLGQRLQSTGQFGALLFSEAEYVLDVPRERYMGAWRSVNDIQSQAGPEGFKSVLCAIEEELGELQTIPVPYKTRAWTVRRIA